MKVIIQLHTIYYTMFPRASSHSLGHPRPDDRFNEENHSFDINLCLSYEYKYI
jgi:hypothetical protein